MITDTEQGALVYKERAEGDLEYHPKSGKSKIRGGGVRSVGFRNHETKVKRLAEKPSFLLSWVVSGKVLYFLTYSTLLMR